MKSKTIAIGLSFFASQLCADSLMLNTMTVYESDQELSDLQKKSVIIKEKNQSNNIADFIKDDPEITLNRKANYGDNGDSLLIRGQGGNRIALNIDGHNINSVGAVGGNYIDFGTIPMDNIEKIEVLKGGSSVEYGNVIGGVINAYTKRPTEKPFFSIYGTTGGWDSASDYYNLRTNFSKTFGDFGISVGASHQEADAYLWNNDYESNSISTRLYYFTPNNAEISLGVIYSDTQRGVIKQNRQSSDPSSSLFEQGYSSTYPISLGDSIAGASGANRAFSQIGEGAYTDKEKLLYDIKYTQPINEYITLNLSAYQNNEDRVDRNYADTSLVTGTSLNDGDLVLEREVEVDKSYGYKLKSTISLDRHKIVVGAERKMLRSGDNVITYMDTEYNGSAGGGGNKNSQIGVVNSGTDIKLDGLFLSDTFLLNEEFELSYGVRYDKYTIDMPKNGETYSQSENGLTPKLGLVYTPTLDDTFGVYIYQMFRAPGSPEANHYLDGIAAREELANKDLEAEKANAFDMVYKHSFDSKTFLQTSMFYYDIDDYILFKLPSTGGRYAYNVDKAKFFGVTINGQYALNDTVALSGGITYQDATKEGDVLDPENSMDRIDYIPDYKVNLGMDWDISSKLKSNLSLTYVGERDYQRTIEDSQALDGYTIVDASIQYEVFPKSIVELYGENLTDKEYETMFGYPSNGRIIGVSYKYVF